MNPPIGIAASVAASGAPKFPSGEALAAAGLEAKYRSVASAARAAADGLVASGEMSDRFATPAAADLTAPHDTGLTIDRNDGLASAAGRAAAHRSVVVVARTDNSAAALDSSSAPAADNFSEAAIRNSAVAVIDSCAAQNNCAPVETGIAAGLQAGWVLVVGVALDAAVATGWVPDGKDAGQDRCDDSARGTALPPKPASLCTRPAGAEIAPLLSPCSPGEFSFSAQLPRPILRIRVHILLDL